MSGGGGYTTAGWYCTYYEEWLMESDCSGEVWTYQTSCYYFDSDQFNTCLGGGPYYMYTYISGPYSTESECNNNCDS